MTEKEKMLRQELYDANYDKSLIADRTRCKVLCQKYNNLPIDDFEAREKLIKEILGKTGKAVYIEPDFWCDYGWNIKVGENFYANHAMSAGTRDWNMPIPLKSATMSGSGRGCRSCPA